MKLTIVAAVAALAATSAQAQETLRLRCAGVATHRVTNMARMFGTNGNGDAVSAEAYETTRQRDDAGVAFEMADGTARIRLPGEMKPLIAVGGNDGWWPVSDLRVSENEIEGRYSLNVCNRPRIRIDRQTGEIEVEGMRPFRGTCVSVADAPRKF